MSNQDVLDKDLGQNPNEEPEQNGRNPIWDLVLGILMLFLGIYRLTKGGGLGPMMGIFFLGLGGFNIYSFFQKTNR